MLRSFSNNSRLVNRANTKLKLNGARISQCGKNNLKSPSPYFQQRHLKHTQITCAQDISELPQSLKTIVGSFQMVPDPMARYKQLLFFAQKLPPMSPELHTPENKVHGCVSQVWVVPTLEQNGTISWVADSDSQLTKGLAALLVQGLGGCTPEEIVKIQPDFIEMLGLKQSLTPSRNNGFLNMFLLMQKRALEMMSTSQNGNGVVEDGQQQMEAAVVE